jgi:hypothetical protein
VPADKAIRQLCHPQAPERAQLARARHRASPPISRRVSWANAVEGWFAKLTWQRLKRDVFTSIVDSKPPSTTFIADGNESPSHLSGQNPQMPSSSLSSVGGKR